MPITSMITNWTFKKFREQARKETGHSGRSLKIKMDGFKQPLDSTHHTDYNGDYALYKVTYDNNSTTVTDMGESGFSLTETHGTWNPLMKRCRSYSYSDRAGSINTSNPALPLIKKFRRAMQSPLSLRGSLREVESDIIIM